MIAACLPRGSTDFHCQVSKVFMPKSSVYGRSRLGLYYSYFLSDDKIPRGNGPRKWIEFLRMVGMGGGIYTNVVKAP
jgi:hypothetical protein